MTIDLRSDTVTLPTDKMRKAMFNCEVGDDVIGEDPTLNMLEEETADLLGKEAALFTPSGTFANQCAIMTHTRSTDEIIVSDSSHIIQHEAGASAKLSGVQTRSIDPENDKHLTLPEIIAKTRLDKDIHYPDTGLICLEQATASGNVYQTEIMKEIYDFAKENNIPVHIDGARLFNASIALDTPAKELAKCCDSVCICLSKGLAAPVGSVLSGTREFIDKARKNRKIMGGGMRQAGFLAAAGLIALELMIDRLKDDHNNAHMLASLLNQIDGVKVTRPVEINMIFMELENENIDPSSFVALLKNKGLLTYPPEAGEYRFVTHHGVSDKDIQNAARIIENAVQEF